MRRGEHLPTKQCVHADLGDPTEALGIVLEAAADGVRWSLRRRRRRLQRKL